MDANNSHTKIFRSKIPPKKLFKALVDLGGEKIKNIEILEGDGGPGTIRLINLAKGGFMKQRIDEVDEENLTYNVTITEVDPLIDNFEPFSSSLKVSASSDDGDGDSGSVVQITSKLLVINQDSPKVDIAQEAYQTLLDLFAGAIGYQD